MSKHTPGPWAMPDSGQGRISKVGANGGWDGLIATADCGDYARSRDEGLANALLIAAAPDMLETLKRLREMCADFGAKTACDIADAAIFKATGEQA